MGSDVIHAGVAAVFTPTTLGLILFGVVLGIIFGVVPGLSATMAVALCLPISFGFAPACAFRASYCMEDMSALHVSQHVWNVEYKRGANTIFQ